MQTVEYNKTTPSAFWSESEMKTNCFVECAILVGFLTIERAIQ